MKTMRAIGVICEYNPFHNGHAYHLKKCRDLAGEDGAVICVMSGDFVQRGEPAIYSKFARAEAAVLGGADLMAELPVPWSLSSAEGFARGGVSLLDRLGVQTLCFGSEAGEVEALSAVAELLTEPATQEKIRKRLNEHVSLSYAAARLQVLQEQLGEKAAVLEQPNNILGIEYIKAISDLDSSMTPVTVKRLGAAHDGREGQLGCRSASEIRELLRAGGSIEGELPKACAEVFRREREKGRQVQKERMETAILSRLRMLDAEAFETLPDAADGLGNRLYKALQNECSLEAVQMAAKTKRYALSRIRRICMCACLGISGEANKGLPPYARILAMNEKGRAYLALIRKKNEIPLLIKPASVDKLSMECKALFALGARAHSFYTLGFSDKAEYHPSEDWLRGPAL